MSTVLTQGIVLKIDHHREYDRQYVIYTSDLGKITAVAKGAKKIVSKLSPHLEQFLVVNLMVARGRSYHRIAAAQTIKNNTAVKNELSKIILATVFLEAVDLLVKNDFIDREVFDILDNFLSTLAISPSRAHSLLLFNKNLFSLLRHLGYQPIIKAKNQNQLANNLATMIMEISERPVKGLGLLQRALV